ncbi:hypothetical protein FPOAC2_11347 [Fusarium poae]
MLAPWSRLWTLLCLLLVFQLVSGEAFRISPRADDDELPKTTAIESKRAQSSTTETAEATGKKTESSQPTSSLSKSEATSVTVTATEKSESSDPTSTSTDGPFQSGLDDSSYYNGIVTSEQQLRVIANKHPSYNTRWSASH